jgi:hypothetical protein
MLIYLPFLKANFSGPNLAYYCDLRAATLHLLPIVPAIPGRAPGLFRGLELFQRFPPLRGISRDYRCCLLVGYHRTPCSGEVLLSSCKVV